MSEARIASFTAFFPYYLGEHRSPVCRRLHFAGTTMWLAFFTSAIAVGMLTNPMRLGIGLLGFALAAGVGFAIEAKVNPLPLVAIAVGSLLWADPLRFGLAMVGAYGFAWVGHFIVEKNRPATFKYPFWSMVADHLMYAKMLSGKLWAGDSLPVNDAASR